MVVTCSLLDVDEEDNAVFLSDSLQKPGSEKRVRGTATCSHCGNEADMWIDL
jgi:hypothetical protein